MKWRAHLSKQSKDFLSKNRLDRADIDELLVRAVRKFQGEESSIDLKKMKAEWAGYYRLRKGKIRAIASFNFEKKSIWIEVIDWRGGAYKK